MINTNYGKMNWAMYFFLKQQDEKKYILKIDKLFLKIAAAGGAPQAFFLSLP